MQITETLYVTNRKDWRKWLVKNHKTKKKYGLFIIIKKVVNQEYLMTMQF